MTEYAYIGLGSNLQHPITQVQSGISAIRKIPQTQLIKTSSLYQSKPWGGIEQDDFINAVVKVRTVLSPLQLLTTLFSIEQQHHRVRDVRFGPRTLDCDLLLYGQKIIQSQELTIPHPRMLDRVFVLAPLLEIEPDLNLPNGQTVFDLLQQCNDKEIIKL